MKNPTSSELSMDRLLNTAEATTFLAYTSKRTLENHRYLKSGPAYIKLPSGAVRYLESELTAWALTRPSRHEPLNTYDALKAARRKARDRERKAIQAAARKAGRAVEAGA